jgi:flavin-dependent dehydrogenase
MGGRMKNKKVVIVGAGLSGLTASIYLAKKGYDVLVLERGKGIGEGDPFHPSLHVTPCDLLYLKRETGIDFENAFKPIKWTKLWTLDKPWISDDPLVMGVERGKRESSIDYFLYKEAKKLGVKFNFSTEIKKIDDVPPNSIIATGFNKKVYVESGRKPSDLDGFYHRRPSKEGEDGTAHLFPGYYTTDYYYRASLNGITFGLLFSRKPMTKKGEEEWLKDMEEKIGEVPEKYTRFRASMDLSKPVLFFKDRICAGTFSATIDPSLGFGIFGAILSGKIAGVAVEDREKALKEFKRVNRFFHIVKFLWYLNQWTPYRLHLAKIQMQFWWLFYPMLLITGRSIPGFPHNYMIHGFKRTRPYKEEV